MSHTDEFNACKTTSLEIQALQKAIQRSKVERARATPLGAKLLEGARLFDVVRERMLCGIRTTFPHYTDQQVEAEFRRILDLQRRREERGTYKIVGELHF